MRILTGILSAILVIALIVLVLNFAAFLLPWRIVYIIALVLLLAAIIGLVRRLARG